MPIIFYKKGSEDTIRFLSTILLVIIFTLLPSFVIRKTVLDKQVGCTLDAKVCPDGSTVGRVHPTCEFSPCPRQEDMSDWKTYTNEKYGFEFQYPSTWTVYESANRIDLVNNINTQPQTPFNIQVNDLVVNKDQFVNELIELNQSLLNREISKNSTLRFGNTNTVQISYKTNKVETVELFAFIGNDYYITASFLYKEGDTDTLSSISQILSTFKFIN